MITIYKNKNLKTTKNGETSSYELRGLSTDEKPTKIEGKDIPNGTIFIEINTGKIFFYDLENKLWEEA